LGQVRVESPRSAAPPPSADAAARRVAACMLLRPPRERIEERNFQPPLYTTRVVYKKLLASWMAVGHHACIRVPVLLQPYGRTGHSCTGRTAAQHRTTVRNDRPKLAEQHSAQHTAHPSLRHFVTDRRGEELGPS
jgi:hypothetical protein